MGSGYDWRNFKNNPKGLLARSRPNIGYAHQALFNGSIDSTQFQAGMDANRVGPLSMSERASVLPMSNRAGFNSINPSNFAGLNMSDRASVLPMSNRVGFNTFNPLSMSERASVLPMSNRVGYNPINTGAFTSSGGFGGGGGKPPTTFAGASGFGGGGGRPPINMGGMSWDAISNSGIGRTLQSKTLGNAAFGALYAGSVFNRLGSDPGMVGSVVFPGIALGLASNFANSAMHKQMAALGAEGAMGFGTAINPLTNKPMTTFMGKQARFSLPGIGQWVMGADLAYTAAQAGSLNPQTAQAGRANLGYSAAYFGGAGLASALGGVGLAPFAAGLASSAVIGNSLGQMMQPSRYERAVGGISNAINSSQQAYTFGVKPAGIPNKLSSLQASSTAISLALDTVLAGGAFVYDVPAKMLGAPTANSARTAFGQMRVDALAGHGQFRGMSEGQAKAAYIASAFSNNVMNVADKTGVYADMLNRDGGRVGFVSKELSLYQDGKNLGLSDQKIRQEEIKAGVLTYGMLSNRFSKEQQLIQAQTRANGRGLFGDYKPLKSTVGSQAVSAVFGKNAGKAFNDANNAVGSAIHGALNWATGPVSTFFGNQTIAESKRRAGETASAMAITQKFLSGRGVAVTPAGASASPDQLLVAASNISGRYSSGGGGYDNSWQQKAEARYRKSEQEQAARERSAIAEAGYRYEAAQRPDVPNFNFNYHALTGGAPHVANGLKATLDHQQSRFQDELARGKEWLLKKDAEYGGYLQDEKRIKADKRLTPLDRIQALTQVEYKKQNVNEGVTQLMEAIQRATMGMKDYATAAVESSKYITEQQAENLTRANYSRRRDARNDRKARLLDRRSMGLISDQRFIGESFEAAREDFADANNQYRAQYIRESYDYEKRKADYETRNGKPFDPQGKYAIGEDGYDLQEIHRGLGYFSEFRREFAERGEKETSKSAEAFALRTSRKKQVQRGLQPYATSFFGTLGRGGSFGDAIKSLQLPFMQDIGNLAVKGLSNLLVGTLDSNQSSNSSKNYLDIATETLKVLDGDTVKMSDGQSIRIAGIDTPEKDQKGGLQAAVFLGKLLKQSKYVSLNQTGTSYGRIVGSLVLGNGKDVGRLMAESGFAKPTFGRYGELSSKYKFDDPSIFRAVNKAAGGSIGGESFSEGLIENLLTAGSVDLGPKPYFGQAYASNNTQSYFSRNGLGDIPIVNGVLSGGAAPVMGVQSSTGGMGGGLANAGLLAGIGGLFKGTGGIGGMVGRFFGKSGTTSIASTLAAKGGMIGKLAGNFSKNGGMGLGSLAAAGNLVAGAVGSIAGSFVGGMISKDHYGSTGGSIGSAVGGTVGSIIGTAFMPVIGTAIGGFLGSLLGGGIGGFFGGGSGKKAAKEQAAAQELHQKTMTVFAPKVKSIMADIDPLDWSSIEGAKNRLRKTNVRGREQTSIRRAAYNDIAKMKEALLPYKDLSDRPGGIAGNLFENKVRAGMSLSAYGPFSDAPASKLYDFYSGIQERLSELKPEQRSQYKQLSQDALGAQRSYLDTQLNLQISRSQSQYGFDVRGAAIESLSRGVAFDQMQRQVNNFDRDSQRSLEQIMGVTQRRGNRSKIAAEMLDERGFQKGILGRNFDILQQSQSLQSDQSSFNLSTALQDINFLTESQKNLATEASKLTPIIGDVNDELLRLLSAIKDVSDALKKI